MALRSRSGHWRASSRRTRTCPPPRATNMELLMICLGLPVRIPRPWIRKVRSSQGRILDVAEDEGWITIPHKALPENWNDVSEMAHCSLSIAPSFFLACRFIFWHACQPLSKIYRLYPPSESLQ